MTWVTTPAGRSLFAELDAAFPERDRRSDGTIAGALHLALAPSSSHNPDDTPGVHTPYSDADSIPEVHADDVDADLRKAGWTLGRVFEIIRSRAASGKERRVRYLICNGRITSVSWGWQWRPYSGADTHDTHGHVDLVYGSGDGPTNPENITAPWGILAAVRAEQPREYVMEKLDGLALPVIRLGDDDAKLAGFNYVGRIQSRLAWLGKYDGVIDGQYGKLTAAGVSTLDGGRDGSVVDLAVWMWLEGFVRVPA